MKKLLLLLLTVLLLLSSAGCGSSPAASASSGGTSAGEPASRPLVLDRLAVELSKTGSDAAPAAAAQFADLLKDALAQGGVTVGQVDVTFGTSYAATAEALDQGGVQLAFLPAEDLIRSGGSAVPLLAAAFPALGNDSADPADWNGDAHKTAAGSGFRAGTLALICTAPTEYGRNLMDRANTSKTLSWAELDHARWGVLDQGSDGGYRCADLWLADHYEGNEIGDLSQVTVYGSYEALLRAAAAGEIDVFPLRADARTDYADAWTLEGSRADARGIGGFGRADSVWNEVQVIGVTERLYTAAAAVTPTDGALSGAVFQNALEGALETIGQNRPDLMDLLGAAHFAPVSSTDLNGLRRLLTMEG